VAPYLRLLGAQVAIGAAAIFARYALTASGPLSAAALRLAIATAALLLLRALRGRGRGAAPWRPAAGASVTLLLAGAALAVHFGTWLASLQYTSVAVSTLLVCTSPLWTALYAWIVHRAAPSRALIAALVLALAGLVLVLTRHDVPAPLPGHVLLGDALAACGGAAMAAYLLLVESLGTSASAPAVSAIVVRTYGSAALFLAAAAVVTRQPLPPANDTVAWGGIAAMALVSQLVGHTALNAALRAFSPSAVALSTMLEPVAAALLAALLLHEATSPLTAVGGALVLCAVVLAAARGTLTAA
jgi:drug/metabolite transporter (DMT)-like permease